MKKQELIKKKFDGASNEEIFEAAKELIENGNWVFEIYNGDKMMLGVDAWEDRSYGEFSIGSDEWGNFNDANPNLWDECEKTLLEAGVYYRDEDGFICVNENYEEE